MNDDAKPAEQMIVGLKRKPWQSASSMLLFGAQAHFFLECAEKPLQFRLMRRLQVYMLMLDGTPLYTGMIAGIAGCPGKKHFRKRRLVS
jgi:hypothetical protein